ncbi:hypothetical protein [Aquimarina algicola]|nr:hypothetical protein [Aquimarina algicola]
MLSISATLITIINAQEHNSADLQKIIKENITKDSISEKKYKPLDFKLQVKNMHLWRGFRVTDAPMTAADVFFTSKNGKFKAGLWGGAGFNGDYTEFDYYINYSSGGFSFSLWDINNFSDFPDAEIFDYDINTTSHFVDLTAAYSFKKVPISVSWTTILLGRDTFINKSGKKENAFTHYVQLNSTIYKNEHSSLDIFIAGAFSFASNDKHFYGEDFLNNFGITYHKEVNVLNLIYLPVSATAMWNPDLKHGGIQVAVDLF